MHHKQTWSPRLGMCHPRWLDDLHGPLVCFSSSLCLRVVSLAEMKCVCGRQFARKTPGLGTGVARTCAALEFNGSNALLKVSRCDCRFSKRSSRFSGVFKIGGNICLSPQICFRRLSVRSRGRFGKLFVTLTAAASTHALCRARLLLFPCLEHKRAIFTMAAAAATAVTTAAAADGSQVHPKDKLEAAAK